MKLHQLYTSVSKMGICILFLFSCEPPHPPRSCPQISALENQNCMTFCMLLCHKVRLVSASEPLLGLAQTQGVTAYLALCESRAAVLQPT